MAAVRQVTEEFTDDIDGTKAAGTSRFSFDGRDYVIDLSKRNANALAKALAPYIDAGRKVPTRRTQGRTAARTVDLAAVRAWAVANGIPVASRGRIPNSVLEQYRAAS